MTFEDIRAVILGRLQAFSGIEQARIDYQLPTKRFEPPADGIWLRVNIEFAPSIFAGMADGPYTRKPGQIVFQCFDRSVVETVGLIRLADALEAHFGYWSSGHLETLETTAINVGSGRATGAPAGTDLFQKNVNVRFRAG